MLGITFLCEGQKVLVHTDSSMYIFPEVAIHVEHVVQELFSTCGVKILEKYLWQCTFFSKVAWWRLAKKKINKKKSLWPLFTDGSITSRLEPLRGGSLLFTTKFPEIHGTHFTNLGRMKGWVELGVTWWFWTGEPWIGNPAS